MKNIETSVEEDVIKQIANDIDIKNLKEENERLRLKIEELRLNNNSFIYTALCKAQAELPIVIKNTSTYGKQNYADLAEIIRMSRPILTKHGLAISQTFNIIDEGRKILLKTILCHTSGQSITSNILLIVAQASDAKANILQEYGKAITYLRRYSYSAIVGIATDIDTDGN